MSDSKKIEGKTVPYKYEIDNKLYYITISIKETDKIINIQIINESDFSERYFSEFSLEYFHNLSDIFKNKTLTEMEKILKNLIENNKYILKVDSNYITIEFNIEFQFIGEIKINIKIPKETLFSENQLKSILIPITDAYHNNITSLVEKIKILEEKNEKIIKKLELLQEENNNLKNYFSKKLLFNNNPSKIVITEEEINFLKEIINNCQFTLLYRATIDGDAFTTFHSKCDGKGTTINLFKTDKNKKWGVYTEYQWNSSGGCDMFKNNSNTKYFLFSISDKKRYLPKSCHTRFNGGHTNIWFCDTI